LDRVVVVVDNQRPVAAQPRHLPHFVYRYTDSHRRFTMGCASWGSITIWSGCRVRADWTRQ
jgi:hypothetical protein